MKLVYCLAGVLLIMGFALANPHDDFIPRLQAMLKYASAALPAFSAFPNEQTALMNEISTIKELIDSYNSETAKKELKDLEKQLKQHAQILGGLLSRLQHMRPIPIQPPHRPDPWNPNGPE